MGAQPHEVHVLPRSVSGPRQTASLFALDGSRAWVSYAITKDLNAVVVWRTVDGGSSWQASEPIDVTRGTDYGAWVSGFLPLGFEFVDDQVGWLYAMTEVPASMMAGDSILLRTEDGGQTWDYVHVTATYGHQGMHFFDRLNGYRLESSRFGEFSRVLRTLDGGEYWSQEPAVASGRDPSIFNPEPPSCLGAYQLEEVSAGVMKMVQNCRTLDPATGEQLQTQLLVTADYGQSWRLSILPIDGLPAWSFNTEFVNQQVGWLLDYQSGALQRTMDGGDSWIRVNTVEWEGELHFIDPLNAWAVAWEAGTNAFNREYALVRTVDSGYSWDLIRPVIE